MKLLRNVFIFICLVFSGIHTTNAAVSSVCEKYTDCDMLVACELTLQVENAINGLATDYEGAVASAVSHINACATYPDKFKKNIDATVSTNPEVKLIINWNNVRNRMRYGDQGNFANSDLDLVNAIVDIFGPDTEAQKAFFTALATAYINADKNNPDILLDDAFVLDFLGTGDNFEKYRLAVRDLTGETFSDEFGIDVSWDDILIEISNVLDKTKQKRGAIVCENNRSYQFGIDAAGWLVAGVAAIFTFWAGGAGGAAVTAGRAAIGAGLKTAAKGLAKAGAKSTAKKISKAGGKQLAKSAIKQGMKQDMRGYVKYAGKGVLKTGVKNYVKIVGKNLSGKWTKIATTTAAIWGLGSAASKSSGGSKFYSLLNSDLDKSFLNCHDLDRNEGCYTVCGDGKGEGDYLNKYALKPVLGKTYCVNPSDYVLYEIKSDGSRGDPLVYDSKHHDQIIKKIKSSVVDKSDFRWRGLKSYYHGCDWNEDDIDMYFGFYIYDPDTFEITTEAIVVDEAIRLDD